MDPDFVPPDEVAARAPMPGASSMTTPLKSPPPAEYDKKLVSVPQTSAQVMRTFFVVLIL